MIGAITGLGGGIIIKPAFDFVGIDTTSMIECVLDCGRVYDVSCFDL